MPKCVKINFCQSSFLYNNIQSYRDKVLVIDTRDMENFMEQSLSGSVSLSYDNVKHSIDHGKDGFKLEKLTVDQVEHTLMDAELDRFKKRKRIYCFIIMSEASFPQDFCDYIKKLAKSEDDYMDFFQIPENSETCINEEFEKATAAMAEKDSVALGTKLFHLLQEDKVRELYVLLDGAEAFFKRYPYMDLSHHSSPSAFIRSASIIAMKLDFTFNFPNDIWDNRLFLGNYNQASQFIIIKSLNITHVVNVTAECVNAHEEKGIKYLHIIILDETEVNLLKFFKEAFEFIDSALNESKNNKVFLHCALGKSRSATITVMFLMKKFGWTFEKALEYVKMKRRIVDPNYGFLKQLEEFEKEKFSFKEKCTYKPDEGIKAGQESMIE